MDLDEAPLLHEPDLMLAVLRVGSQGDATPCACVEHLRRLREQAHEPPVVAEADVRSGLDAVMCKLARAKLIERLPQSGFRTTARGRGVLAANPRGVDDTVLMQFDEFRAALGRGKPRLGADDPMVAPYEGGFAAYQAGRGLADNPYPADSCAHQHWQNGWSHACDEARRQARQS
jgi:restriction system protein